MARKFLYGVALAVVLVIGSLLGLHYWAKELSTFAFVPSSRFTAPPALAPNAYENPSMWISRGADEGDGNLPGGDPARWLPAGVSQPEAPLEAAVFFVHPTSQFGKGSWNASLADVLANNRAEMHTRGLASPFNAARELWAPRYRQATMGAFLTGRADAGHALDVAHGDVLAAFDEFIRQTDPKLPIVLVGHSQGSLHLMRLMRERVAGTPLARRIVAAYLVGWPVSLAHDLPLMGLPACSAPDQSGCVLSWQSFAEPADPALVLEAYARMPGLDGKKRKGSPFLCTNPLTGEAGGSAPASANLGTLVPNANLTGGALTPGAVSASCRPDGFLSIGPAPEMGPYVLPGNNYHIYDIPLFWANVRADVARRVEVWHQQNSRGPKGGGRWPWQR